MDKSSVCLYGGMDERELASLTRVYSRLMVILERALPTAKRRQRIPRKIAMTGGLHLSA